MTTFKACWGMMMITWTVYLYSNQSLNDNQDHHDHNIQIWFWIMIIVIIAYCDHNVEVQVLDDLIESWSSWLLWSKHSSQVLDDPWRQIDYKHISGNGPRQTDRQFWLIILSVMIILIIISIIIIMATDREGWYFTFGHDHFDHHSQRWFYFLSQ